MWRYGDMGCGVIFSYAWCFVLRYEFKEFVSGVRKILSFLVPCPRSDSFFSFCQTSDFGRRTSDFDFRFRIARGLLPPMGSGSTLPVSRSRRRRRLTLARLTPNSAAVSSYVPERPALYASTILSRSSFPIILMLDQKLRTGSTCERSRPFAKAEFGFDA